MDRLRELPDRQWRSALGTSHSAFNWLGDKLDRFGIKSHTMRIGAERVKGYDLADFTEALTRLVPPAGRDGTE